jgi:hypothetical protein
VRRSPSPSLQRAVPTTRSEVGWFTRYVTESRVYGAGLVAASLALLYGLLTMSDASAATAEFGELFATSKLVRLCALSALHQDTGLLPACAIAQQDTLHSTTHHHTTARTPPHDVLISISMPIWQVHVSTIDLAILSTFVFEPIREDMARRGWWDEGAANNIVARLAAFSALPVIGPALYLMLRPPLEE